MGYEEKIFTAGVITSKHTVAELEGCDKLGRMEVLRRFSFVRIELIQRFSHCISLSLLVNRCEDYKISVVELVTNFL